MKVEVPKKQGMVAILAWSFGSIALFPQGLVPILFKAFGVEVRSWFLALYLTEPLQYPVAGAMALLGCCLYYVAVRAGRGKEAMFG